MKKKNGYVFWIAKSLIYRVKATCKGYHYFFLEDSHGKLPTGSLKQNPKGEITCPMSRPTNGSGQLSRSVFDSFLSHYHSVSLIALVSTHTCDDEVRCIYWIVFHSDSGAHAWSPSMARMRQWRRTVPGRQHVLLDNGERGFFLHSHQK